MVECKATKSKIDIEFVMKWLNQNIPFTRKWLLENHEDGEMEFQLWSVGGFTADAIALLSKASSETSKYTIRYFNRQQMMGLAKEKNDMHFIEIMKSHFTNWIS